MNYFILKAAVNTKETGKSYPQISKMSKGYDYKAKNSIYEIEKFYNQFPKYKPNLDSFILDSQAKLSDLLSVGILNKGLLISVRFKSILEKYNLPTHQFYKATVVYKQHSYEYYWLNILCNLTDFINYKESSFFIYLNYTHNIGDISVSSKEDLFNKKNALKKNNPDKTITIWAQKLCFDRNINFDLFEIGEFDANYYLSESLKHAIEEAKLTGCLITHTDKICTI